MSSDDFFSYTTSFSNDFVNLNSNTPDTTFNQDEVLDALTSKMNEKSTVNKATNERNDDNEETETENDDEDEEIENFYYNQDAQEENDEDSDDYYHYSNEKDKTSKKEEIVKLRRNQPKQVNFK